MTSNLTDLPEVYSMKKSNWPIYGEFVNNNVKKLVPIILINP